MSMPGALGYLKEKPTGFIRRHSIRANNVNGIDKYQLNLSAKKAFFKSGLNSSAVMISEWSWSGILLYRINF